MRRNLSPRSQTCRRTRTPSLLLLELPESQRSLSVARPTSWAWHRPPVCVTVQPTHAPFRAMGSPSRRVTCAITPSHKSPLRLCGEARRRTSRTGSAPQRESRGAPSGCDIGRDQRSCRFAASRAATTLDGQAMRNSRREHGILFPMAHSSSVDTRSKSAAGICLFASPSEGWPQEGEASVARAGASPIARLFRRLTTT